MCMASGVLYIHLVQIKGPFEINTFIEMKVRFLIKLIYDNSLQSAIRYSFISIKKVKHSMLFLKGCAPFRDILSTEQLTVL